ncbi:MAG: nucleotidyltransferase domain-containing protein [Candidatus Bathyarchaeia archaeon]
MIELEVVREAAIRVCRELRCVYVILFGSRALGYAKVYSDVDVAIKIKDPEDTVDAVVRASSIFEEILGVEVDVVILNSVDTILRYEVFSGGIPILVNDYGEYMDDFVNAIDEYLDFKDDFEVFYRRIVGRIRDAVSRG